MEETNDRTKLLQLMQSMYKKLIKVEGRYAVVCDILYDFFYTLDTLVNNSTIDYEDGKHDLVLALVSEVIDDFIKEEN